MKNKFYDKKVFRLIAMLSKFNQGGSVKTPDLAREFGVTHRTVQRDMRLLENVGFSLVNDHNGHRFGEGVTLQKMLIMPEERFLVDVFWTIFSRIGDPFDSIAEKFLSRTLSVTQNVDSKDAFTTGEKKVIMQGAEKFSELLRAKLGKKDGTRSAEGKGILKPKMSCTNCLNFKQRTLERKDVMRVNVNDSNTYDKCHYPVNKTILKKIHKEGNCEIFYCSKGLQKKNVYIQALKDGGKIAPVHEFCPGRE